VNLPVEELDRHGCHLTPPIPCPPLPLRSAEKLRLAALFLPAQGIARSRRRFAGFLARKLSSPPPNSPPPAVLRPSQPHRRVPGESLVRPYPSPRLAARRIAGHGRPPACLGQVGLGLCPSRPDQRGQPRWPGPPQSAALGQLTLCTKSYCKQFSVFQKFQKNAKCCKIHRKLSACRKIAYDLPKCSEKRTLHVYVKFMHL
jgi:hypothetical protein